MTGLSARLGGVLLASAFFASALASGPAFAKPPGAVDFNTVKGESTTRDHKDFQAVSVSWGAMGAVRTNGVASDPEQGGQIAKAASKPKVSDISITKGADVSSPKMMSAAPASSGEPLPAGTATVTVARGTCTSGQHLPEATIHVGARSYTLEGVDVGSCTDAGGGNQTCTLTYASIGG